MAVAILAQGNFGHSSLGSANLFAIFVRPLS